MRTSPIASLPLELAVVEFAELVISREPFEAQGRCGNQTSKTWILGSSPRMTKRGAEDDNKMLGLLTPEKLTDCWPDFIESMKPYQSFRRRRTAQC